MSGNSNTYNRQIFSEKFFFTCKGKLNKHSAHRQVKKEKRNHYQIFIFS